MEIIEVNSEYSTQPYGQKPNPMVEKAIKRLVEKRGCNEENKVADQGCGALRNLKVMMEWYNDIYLVDTEHQINRRREIEGKRMTIKEYVENIEVPNKKLGVINNKEFLKTNLGLGLVFNICTFDVVLRETRREMLEAATRNLNKGGYLILIVPRNDSSILCRCKEENKYSDGYFFRHHGVCTFYSNFRKHDSLVDMASRFKLELVEDLSVYRQVCLMFNLK